LQITEREVNQPPDRFVRGPEKTERHFAIPQSEGRSTRQRAICRCICTSVARRFGAVRVSTSRSSVKSTDAFNELPSDRLVVTARWVAEQKAGNPRVRQILIANSIVQKLIIRKVNMFSIKERYVCLPAARATRSLSTTYYDSTLKQGRVQVAPLLSFRGRRRVLASSQTHDTQAQREVPLIPWEGPVATPELITFAFDYPRRIGKGRNEGTNPSIQKRVVKDYYILESLSWCSVRSVLNHGVSSSHMGGEKQGMTHGRAAH